MDNVTDFVFREIVATRLPRPDVFFTEFTSVEALCSKGRKRVICRLKYSQNQRPIVAQLWGLVPEAFQESAKFAAELGFDGIDLNMGCPDRSIARRGACSGLIRNPDLAAKIIRSVHEGAPTLPVSVKTRIGFNRIVTGEWVTHLLNQNINALILHGRIATQMSHGEANWEEIGKAVQIRDRVSPDTIVLGNGDIKSFAQALEYQKEYGVDGAMIGRGIFHDPWIFGKNSTHQPYAKEEYISVLLAHLKLYGEIWGSGHTFEPMKKFFKMYIKNFSGADGLRQKLMLTKNISEALALLF